MGLHDIFRAVHACGCRLTVEDGTLFLAGPSEQLPADLLAAVRERKADLLALLARPIECLWPGTGYVGPLAFPESGWPCGAISYRYAGETAWRPIHDQDRFRPPERNRGAVAVTPEQKDFANSGALPAQEEEPCD